MKKLIALIAIIAIVATTAFAATTITSATNGAWAANNHTDVTLKTTIAPQASGTWRIAKITTAPTSYAALTTDVTDNSFIFSTSNLAYTAYTTVITNMDAQATVTVTAYPLTKATGETAIDANNSIAYTVKLGEDAADSVGITSVEVGSWTTTGNGLRLQDKTVVFATTAAALNAAEAGDYTATVQMAITTAN